MSARAWFRGALGCLLMALLVIAVPAAPAQTDRAAAAQDDVTGMVGQPVTLDNEQIHTVVRIERWYGGGYWFPKPGDAAITVQIRVQAIETTSYNPLYYSIRDAVGTSYGRVILGYRYESLGSSASMPAGAVGEGWLTFLVPVAKVNELTLVYHMHAGFGSTLTVPLGAVPDSAQARLGQSVNIEGEQIHTVVRAQRWAGDGFWKPRAGQVYVTWYVRVKALKPTTFGGTYYSLRTPNGTMYHGFVSGNRKPRLSYTKSLSAGRTAQGWVTMMVPKTQLRSLTLVYHMHDNGPNLLVRLPIR
ncbi:MAG: hypothetical protein ACXW0F_00775 [Gaiellaceae bacterium]